jgi:hypothetical protein
MFGMEFLRKSTIGLACLILFASTIFFGVARAFRQVVGQPAPLESALNQTNTYNTLVPNFIQSHEDDTTIGVPLTIPVVQVALQKAFPKSVVQPAVNQLISGTYAWAQGKTPTLTFHINLASAKTNLADYVQQAAEQQAAKLPVCSEDQLHTINPQIAFQNPLSVTCLPPGISIATVGSYAQQAVLDSSFLQNPVVTPASLHLTSNNKLKLPAQQSQSSQTLSLPHIYHQLMESIYVSIALIATCIGTIIWLHRDHFKGMGRAGVIIGWAGLICVLDAVVAGEIPKWLTTHNSLHQQTTGGFQQTIIKVVAVLAEDFHRWLLWYGVILLVVGLGVWLGILVWRRKRQAPTTPPVSTAMAPTGPVQIA